MDNCALIFIKPHAANRETQAFIEKRLSMEGIIIEKTGSLSGTDIDSRGIIDRHYFSISQTAMSVKPSQLPVSDAGKKAFSEKYDTEWNVINEKGRIFNSADYMKFFGIKDGKSLADVWSSGTFLKLGPGLYACHIPATDSFLVNGFYPGMREKFTAADAVVHWYTVSFSPQTLSWKKFREGFIGATDPSKAVEGSIRNELFSHYTEYALSFQPTMSDNGIHASAGPVEGMRERMVWAGLDPEESGLGKTLMANGLSKEALYYLLENGECSFAETKGPVFDITEDTDAKNIAGNISVTIHANGQ